MLKGQRGAERPPVFLPTFPHSPEARAEDRQRRAEDKNIVSKDYFSDVQDNHR